MTLIQDSPAPRPDLHSDLHPDWAAEIDRRIAALDAGQVRLMEASEMLTRLGQHIRSRPSAATSPRGTRSCSCIVFRRR